MVSFQKGVEEVPAAVPVQECGLRTLHLELRVRDDEVLRMVCAQYLFGALCGLSQPPLPLHRPLHRGYLKGDLAGP
jgi:hypothetical protein